MTEHNTKKEYRIEHDSMGEIKIPADALYGAQTQRALENFPISGLRIPRRFIHALGLIKATAAQVNTKLEYMDKDTSQAIQKAAQEVADGKYDEHFPIDVFQTGSGTSSNMNANEVIAHLASALADKPIHPNDHVNMGQSSNDVIPTAIHVSAAIALTEDLLPALDHLHTVLINKAKSLSDIVKTGRTHLMDAMPVRFDQEIGGWAAQIESCRQRLLSTLPRITALAQGGTAVGTGINADPRFSKLFATVLSEKTDIAFSPNENFFESLSSQDSAVELSGQLRVTAVALNKIANDLRWMNSGPLAGLGEISLPALQPGSSIMPGKVNPVIPEAVCMVAAQVIGNDVTITMAGQAGNFQLNVMLPVIAYNLLQNIQLLTNASRALADRAIAGFVVNKDKINEALSRNPILVTALNTVIGYEKGAEIAKRAYKEGRSVLEVAQEMTNLSKEELDRLLNPTALTEGGIQK
jgi:fumarate hydratase class II